MGWLGGSARMPCVAIVGCASYLAACEPTGRPWRDAAGADADAPNDHTDGAASTDLFMSGLDAVPAGDSPLPDDRAAGDATPLDAAQRLDTPVAPMTPVPPPEDAGIDARVEAGSTGRDACTEAERAVLTEAITLFDRHAYTGSSAFRACVVDAVLSPSPSAYLEELISRIRDFSLAESRCDASLPGDGDAHSVVQMEPDSRGAMVVSVSAAALRTRSAARIAGAILHRHLDAEGYFHPGTEAGERRFGAPYALERCLALAAGEHAAPYSVTRSAMRLEAELQPFGIVRPWIGANFYAACPPGTWVTGQGVNLRPVAGTVPVNRVIGIGLRCTAPSGGATTTIGSTPITGWADCPTGSVAVGFLGDANNNGVYSARVQCAPWSAVRTPEAPVSTVSLERIAGGFVVQRRCPPGQALYAVSGTQDTAGWFKTMALHCHDVDAPRPGPFTALPAVGLSGSTLPRSSRDTRCADHGVVVGFTGHRMRDGILNRFGALCRSTEGLGEGLRFRTIAQGDAGLVSPEHPLPSVGSDPDDPLRPGTAFELAGGSFQGLRCPEGMAVVGMRVRQGGEPSLPRHVQTLCAPVGAWMRDPPPEPVTVNLAGDWPAPAGETVQTVRCAPRSFLAGLELSTVSPVSTGAVLERIVGVCRAFSP